MSGRVESRLAELGLVLPTPALAVANYLPFVVSGSLVFVSGQLPLVDGKITVSGRLGAEVSLEDGQSAARQCAINLLAQARAAAGGDLDRVRQVVRLGGFVASTPDFTDQPKVVNSASDLMVAVLGDAGRHSRAAVGVASLPLNAAVEIEAIFELV
ncbi:RidA family protein [Magnetospirillum fulvum]|uniref:Enamine deaminase RidA, house cleaning of reactive enamine intermediates, YjgF/YER057c/UK114 family n=1 Tax=Magnetospirillum fulvum TaxID=1082 RepID=A0A1H6I6U2_MAGFU|nr:RidA family protein [Magnetospirillum fulvum]SEH43322.1 Enamine deaminase RidA, house cleaning of reactive enamine intermediates, YjgF/YER057c/UK114 family [Magnetospirillum fulvum]